MDFDISGARIFFRIPTGIPILGDILISETLVVTWPLNRSGSGLVLGAAVSFREFNSFLSRWRKRYKIRIDLVEVTDFTVLQHEMFNEKGDKLE